MTEQPLAAFPGGFFLPAKPFIHRPKRFPVILFRLSAWHTLWNVLRIGQRQTRNTKPKTGNPMATKTPIPPDQIEWHNIISLGAGTQSTLLYLHREKETVPFTPDAVAGMPKGIARMVAKNAEKNGGLYERTISKEWRPAKIDRCIFADTGEEPGPVMDHLQWLIDNHELPIDVRSGGKLGEDLIRGQNSRGKRFASIPAFTATKEEIAAGKSPGMLRRQCTREYKLDPIYKWLRREVVGLKPRQRMPKNVRFRVFIGMSADEEGRAYRVMNNAKPYEENHFPLIDMGFDRARTIHELETAFDIPHEVPRSACTFCPFRGNDEWLELRRVDPAGFQRAVEIDAAIRDHDARCNKALQKEMFIHRSCVPLGEIDWNAIEADMLARPEQLALFERPDCMGACGT